MPELNPESVSYTSATSLTKRKQLGQYMTPPIIGDLLVKKLSVEKGYKILDPAVGTGELLLSVIREVPAADLELHGWDVDPEILKSTVKTVPEAILKEQSVFNEIDPKWNEYFDLIIGNPPYFELKKDEFDSESFEVSSGRTNIYSLFFEKYLPLVKENGYLAFIVPPSMNAGAYFSSLREYILKNSIITHLEVIRHNKHFTDALTSVQVIILKKGKQRKVSNPFVIDFNKLIITPSAPIVFTDNKKLINKHWKNKNSIYSYGYEVVTGSIPWNQFKDDLSTSKVLGSSILYYAKDIGSNNAIQLSPLVAERRWLQSHRATLSGEVILVNRIVGSLENPKLKVAMVKNNSFYAENHTNVIKKREGVTPTKTLVEIFEGLAKYEGLSEYLKALTGNTQLSAKELMYLIPV